MNTKLKIITVALLSAMVFSCGEKAREAKETLSLMEDLKEGAEEMEKAVEKSNDKLAERRERGDTLAMNYKDLGRFLPASLGEYERQGEPKGNSINMPGMSYSEANASYIDGEDNMLSVELIDYNTAANMFVMATAAYGVGIDIESDSEHTKGFKENEDLSGWTVLQKENPDVTVFIGIAQRFFLKVEADNTDDVDKIKELALKIAKKELVNL